MQLARHGAQWSLWKHQPWQWLRCPRWSVRAGLDEWYYHWTVGRLCV